MDKQAIWPKNGPPTKGPYSPAVVYGDLVFVSGQGPVDAATGAMLTGDVVDEFRRAMINVETILAGAGSSLGQVLKVTLYLRDMADFARVNEVYKEYFGPVYPARTTLQAGRLPFDIKVEIDVIASRSAGSAV
ncbi:MAG: reactive intermediate/imine deaminase [Lentisphaerae bacterium]|nr:reactive intermediate/imine deaminase [Lentisphaerota bacterium]